jgi:hypothetical protein
VQRNSIWRPNARTNVRERALTCTWVMDKVRLAVQKGYIHGLLKCLRYITVARVEMYWSSAGEWPVVRHGRDKDEGRSL